MLHVTIVRELHPLTVLGASILCSLCFLNLLVHASTALNLVITWIPGDYAKPVLSIAQPAKLILPNAPLVHLFQTISSQPTSNAYLARRCQITFWIHQTSAHLVQQTVKLANRPPQTVQVAIWSTSF